ncbi:MAG: hypothetical protein M1587_05640, partial [Thaumarchaeota archaeon]|nr:hypothetical protein [Nitrososphaerota archaeon]
MKQNNFAMSRAAATALVLIALITVVGAVVIANNAITAGQPSSTITSTSTVTNAQSTGGQMINQTPVTHYITLTWELSPQALQDRFTPFNIVVSQGDTVHITFIVNDSVAHTFTIGAPYNFQINASVPGFTNDLTGKTFTQNATNNSPGVVVTGMPGNVTATGSFVAKYAGVFEYYCVYHVQVGMFGYLTVLPNAAYSNATTTTTVTSTTTNASNPQVSIQYGSAANTTSVYYSPPTITVVIGVNNTMTWVNNDIAPHTVTADDGSFNSGNLNAGECV